MKIVLTCFVLVGLGIVYAPSFLVYSYPCGKADCVIVMVGPEVEHRVRGAELLVEQGRSEVLLIPAYNKVVFAGDSGLGERGNIKVAPEVGKPVTFMGRKFRVFENTHLELIKGKKIMDKLGYYSVIIVSSPYHMRRLHLIAGKVFGQEYQIGFAATPFERYDTLSCFSSWEGFANVWNEYLKIGWFLVYSWFV